MQFRMTLKRFAFAIIGGLIIVVPMLILAVGSATVQTLAAISTSIFVFAVSVAIFSTTEPGNLLAATAADAAVLMALIGGSGRMRYDMHTCIMTSRLRDLSEPRSPCVLFLLLFSKISS